MEKIVKEDEWLIFNLCEKKPKTNVYEVISKCDKTILGWVKWYPQWRHYCFFPNTIIETVHSDRCLISISEFITKTNEEHRKFTPDAKGEGK